MSAAEDSKETGLKERFFVHFQNEVVALQEQMERLSQISPAGGERNEAIDHCLAGIDRLSHEVKDASGYIPAYDQRTYGETIKALSEKVQNIRNYMNPPKKFQFKTRKKASAFPTNDAAELAKSQKIEEQGFGKTDSNANSSFTSTHPDRPTAEEENGERELTEENVEDDGIAGAEGGPGIRRPSFSKATKVSILRHEGLHIIIPTSASHATSSGTVSNIKRCVVDLSLPTANGAPFVTLYLKNIKDSLIICGHVAGPIHITDIENSVIVTSCRQFRMHGSKNVDIYLHCGSRPIFEDCDGLRFTPLPEAHMTNDILHSVNQWDQIDDFKWLKAEPSPHFNILPESLRIDASVWSGKMLGGHDATLDDILKAVGVSQ